MADPGRLEALLAASDNPAIAVSGGVDSMTLASFAHRRGIDCTVVHAVSPAVPEEATRRVREHAASEAWNLRIIDAREFADPDYVANPANRCFFCKTNLYGTMAEAVGGTLLSGTNLDDLDDWRPGLEAAKQHGVRHPFVEAQFTKQDVRALALEMGLRDLSELPASPCLSSRVETGIAIDPVMLRRIDLVESELRRRHGLHTLRCRRRVGGYVLEIDAERLDGLSAAQRQSLAAEASALAKEEVQLAAYRRGSAFLRDAK